MIQEEKEMNWEESEQLIRDSKRYLNNTIPVLVELNPAEEYTFTGTGRFFEWSDSPSNYVYANLMREGKPSFSMSLEDVMREFKRKEAFIS
ncbi:hypothetical protein [Dyadobacter bucti]|uniref:hypothetical protein n=1 Tax=Dyadobacter bucti TaxID=2572203 RepID=UPI003F6E8239